MGILKDIADTLDKKLFIGKDGKRVETLITGNRFNAGMGVKLPSMKLKDNVQQSVVKAEEKLVKTSDFVDELDLSNTGVKKESQKDLTKEVKVVEVENKSVEGLSFTMDKLVIEETEKVKFNEEDLHL